jgi:hypothetical protein
MKRTAILICALALSACSQFTNRVSVVLGTDEVLINSMYGPLGITSKVDARDAEVIREIQRLKAVLEAMKRQQ